MTGYGSINSDVAHSSPSNPNEYDSDKENLHLLAGASVSSVNVSSNIQANRRGSTWYYSVFIIVNAALGAGLLNFPAAYHKAGGIGVALPVQAILLSFIVGSLVLLAYCSDLNKATTYQSVVSHMCGRWGQISCSVMVALYCFGTCITFFIIISDQLDRVFAFVYGNTFCHVWYMNRSFTLTLSSVILILPLCFPKKIDFLKHASAAGVVAIFYLVILVPVEYYTNPHLVRGEVRTKPAEWTDIFAVIPVICFGYQCHVSVIPIYSCFSHRRLSHFTKSIVLALILCVVAYSLVAVYGYLSFGSDVESDVLLSYPSNDIPSLVGRLMMAIKTYTTYPILLFCGRAAVDDLFLELSRSRLVLSSIPEVSRRVGVTLVWFCVSLALAIVIPNIGEVISFLGSLAAVFIFVYPGLCLLQRIFVRDPEMKRVKYKLFVFVSVLYVGVGMFIFGVVIVQSIQGSMSPGHRNLPPVCKPKG